ncbi:hypothetical protein EGT74_17525 [Chitinophaga lutea]|uniref:Acyloxyacyl hydrolase n=1 Tax=Chitinophaga lutea TaxID=2488634 RepID=A0A3N4PMK7_9BACT|nr:acyloxyacyl hydrolase [Chitinophaga lutea]RPE08828.1 hypothetical protein EGT74_17525 [Chitinophaga lutea]
MKKTIWIITGMMAAMQAHAQDTTDLWRKARQNPNLGRQKYAELRLHSGSHLYTGQALSEFLQHGYTGVEVRVAWQSTGRETWQRAFNYPNYGIGFYTGNIGDATVLGNPSGVYGFFNAPFLRRKRHQLEAGLALGFTYDLNTYDSVKNPLNDAISSKIAVYFNLAVTGVWKMNELFDLTYGLDLTHFSNGRTHTPNLGLNMYGLHVGLRYHYNPLRRIAKQQIEPGFEPARRTTYDRSPVPRPDRYHQLSLYGAFGVVQHPGKPRISAFYGTASTALDYTYRYGHLGSIGAGVDGFYDASLGQLYRKYATVRATDKMQAGVHLGHNLHIQRLELVTHVGAYVLQRDGEKGKMYMRIGLRYNISRRAFAQVGLKTLKGATADWIEWGGGGVLYRSK